MDDKIAESAYACRHYAPQLRSKALEEAADLIETLARDVAAARDRAEKAEAGQNRALDLTEHAQDRWNEAMDKRLTAEADRDRLAAELAEARKLSQNEAYYFRAVLRRLHEMRSAIDDAVMDEGGAGVSMIGCEALSDEIEWLDGWLSEKSIATLAKGDHE